MTTADISVTRIKELIADERTRPQALDELGAWAKTTCLLFGSTPTTAYQIAWMLVEGVAAAHEERKPDFRIVR